MRRCQCHVDVGSVCVDICRSHRRTCVETWLDLRWRDVGERCTGWWRRGCCGGKFSDEAGLVHGAGGSADDCRHGASPSAGELDEAAEHCGRHDPNRTCLDWWEQQSSSRVFINLWWISGYTQHTTFCSHILSVHDYPSVICVKFCIAGCLACQHSLNGQHPFFWLSSVAIVPLCPPSSINIQKTYA